jgi:hypothetical protein
MYLISGYGSHRYPKIGGLTEDLPLQHPDARRMTKFCWPGVASSRPVKTYMVPSWTSAAGSTV